METQNKMLKNLLDNNNHVSALYALNKIGTMRLAARIYDIKQEGYPVDKYVREVDGKRVTYYFKSSTSWDLT